MKLAFVPATADGRSFLVGAVWLLAALPFVTGVMTCPTARLLHVACPGCGMTRAFDLLAAGDLAGSFAMHPLAVPTALSQVALAVASIAATRRFAEPWALVRTRWGRAAVAFAGLVVVLDVALWIARALGAFGGPVPV